MIQKHLPNFLTFLRVLLIPVFIFLFWKENYLSATFVFILAALTDWFDGYLARRFQVLSPFGAFFDPVADKLLVISAVVLIVARGPLYLSIPAIIIIGREIAISALREWMAELGKRSSVAVSAIGKIKTGVQMISVIMLIVHDPKLIDSFSFIAFLGFYLAAALTLFSMSIYIIAAWKALK